MAENATSQRQPCKKIVEADNDILRAPCKLCSDDFICSYMRISNFLLIVVFFGLPSLLSNAHADRCLICPAIAISQLGLDQRSISIRRVIDRSIEYKLACNILIPYIALYVITLHVTAAQFNYVINFKITFGTVKIKHKFNMYLNIYRYVPRTIKYE